jgi:hypothetical protein
MPSGRFTESLYIGPFQNIEAMNSAVLYKPGELGSHVELGAKAYQLVQVDSGAALSTAGAPLAGQIAFWKNKAAYIVTNDKIQAEGATLLAAGVPTVTIANAINSVAGVFCSLAGGAAGTASITSGYYGVVQQRGPHVGVLTSSGTAANGDFLIALTTGAPPGALRVAAGTALVSMPVARATAATSIVTSGYTPAVVGGWDLVSTP